MQDPTPVEWEPTFAELKAFVANAADDDPARLYSRFKFLVHDKKGRALWQALHADAPGLDRNDLVLRVWNELATTHPEAITEQYHSLAYHRHWLFEWLLRRYDVRRSREVVAGGSWQHNAHLLLLAAVAGAFALRRLEGLGSQQTLGALLLCGAAYVVVLAWLTHTFHPRLSDRLEALTLATHSLVPRLAGASAVGLVILTSSQELLKVVVATNWWWLPCLLLAGYGYLLLEMARRVHPLPRLRRLALHGFDVAATALAHSMTLTLLAEGALRKVLLNDGGSYGPLTWCQSLSVVVFVFTIGLVVNLIWTEQPVTEPL